MCGIVGYIGPQPAAPLLLRGLEKLEYRGYDSAGLAVREDDKLRVIKTVGRLQDLRDILEHTAAPRGTLGIGHTRWATHGRPSDENAHPHTDCSGRIAVVHNGIIENYKELREWLVEDGHTFKSETDTETVAHLIESFYEGDLVAAVRKTIKRLEGSYALGVIHLDEPEVLVAARQDSPLIVGLGEGENFLASDIPAVLEHTRKVYILDDGEVARLTADKVEIIDATGSPVDKDVFEVAWDPVMAEKGGYDHFMIKEIYEQPKAVRDTLKGRVAEGRVVLDDVDLDSETAKKIKKIYITAAGTAYHAGLVGKYVIEKLARIPVEVDLSSEFRYRDLMIDEDCLTVVISQSGETADTLASLREAKRRGSRILAITNVVGSSVSRETHDVIYTWAGPEIAVASTKAYLTQLVSLYLLALYLAQERGTIDQGQLKAYLDSLQELPQGIQAVLDSEQTIAELAQEFKEKEDIFFIGRGLDYAVAMEGSLKLKEISYIHAEAYAAGELKHGTLALIVEGVPVFALATQTRLRDKMVSNMKEVKARDATIITVANRGDESIKEASDRVIYIPETEELFRPVLAVVPLQLFAYHAALARGCDVDKPRNLAKSVTVE
ncbi:MAG: glutamine--fructose-6-phosphate transaminase (isomerizing) [Firmicutes bacterium]|nr:glutamine--fructose-6-phosphate transaminase (isomerizing) [Bacillota bacterium]